MENDWEKLPSVDLWAPHTTRIWVCTRMDECTCPYIHTTCRHIKTSTFLKIILEENTCDAKQELTFFFIFFLFLELTFLNWDSWSTNFKGIRWFFYPTPWGMSASQFICHTIAWSLASSRPESASCREQLLRTHSDDHWEQQLLDKSDVMPSTQRALAKRPYLVSCLQLWMGWDGLYWDYL